MNELKFEIECDDYRVLKIPNTSSVKAKIGTLFIKVENLPTSLGDWTEVNPRLPKKTSKEKLSGQVARSIVRTLEEEPDKFALKNLGIYLLVDSVHDQRISGDRHKLNVVLTNRSLHGIVNGGHTYQAIQQVLVNGNYDGGAYVRLHIYQNISSENIVELAEGLNKNLQVTNASLENLQKKFETIKKAMTNKKGENEIAYADGDDGSVDILEVLHILSLLDLKTYPDQDKNPNDIFGSKQKVLKRYIEDLEKGDDSSFKRLIPKTDEILKLSDEIKKRCAIYMSNHKIKNTETGNRVGSNENKKHAIFTDGEIGGLVPQGWLYPMVSAFRANISKKSWEAGSLVWLEDPFKVLDEVKDSLGENIKNAHKEQRNRPAEVGRKSTAYQVCYGSVFTKLAMKGKIGNLS